MGNTQSNFDIIAKIDTGTSAQGHTWLLINAKWASTAQRGLKVDMSTTGTWEAIEITGTNARIKFADGTTQSSAWVTSDTSWVTWADSIINMMSLTTAEYWAITPDASTLYIITDA